MAHFLIIWWKNECSNLANLRQFLSSESDGPTRDDHAFSAAVLQLGNLEPVLTSFFAATVTEILSIEHLERSMQGKMNLKLGSLTGPHPINI